MKRRTKQEIEEMKKQGVRFHLHHINPRHNGGGDEPENLILLTISEHAEEHKKLYERHGKVEDLIAYKALSGKTSFSEARRAAAANAVWDEKRRKRASEVNKKARAEGKLANIGDIMRGKEFSEEHKQKLSEIAKKREKVKCPLCGVSAIKQVLSMWHGKGKCDVSPDLDSDKTCRDCGEAKKLRDFPIYGRKQNGHPKHKNWCKVCENKRRSDRRRKS